uniref:Uncharacterized protein n=1 Tax=Picea sitchensis TaxID=3332 RepID=D5A8N6_PICSI|nr:unknown [Picea sitchensis]
MGRRCQELSPLQLQSYCKFRDHITLLVVRLGGDIHNNNGGCDGK